MTDAELRALADDAIRDDAALPSGVWCARETYVYRTDDPRDHRQKARVPGASLHACQHCGLVWRPAIVATCGVQFLPGFKSEVKP